MKLEGQISQFIEDVKNRVDLKDIPWQLKDGLVCLGLESPDDGKRHYYLKVPEDTEVKQEALHHIMTSQQCFPQRDKPDFKSVQFLSRMALGDALMMTCGIRDFKRAYPEVEVRATSIAPRIWDNIPYINQELDAEKKINIGTGWLTNKSNSLNLHMANAYRLSIQNATGLRFEQGPIRPDIWLSEEEYDASPLIEGPYWVIIAGGEPGWPLKCYPIERWQEVVNMLPQIKFVQLGAEEHTHLHGRLENQKGNLIDMVGKTQDPQTGLRDVFKIFLHAQGSVGLVSFHMHLSAAFQNPCVVVAAAREPAWFTQYMGHQYIQTGGCLPCAKTRACWHCSTNKCLNLVEGKLPKCVDMIFPDEIVRGIKRYYEGGRLVMGKKIKNSEFKNVNREKAAPKSAVRFSGATISPEGYRALERFCQSHPSDRILEYGPGVSTQVFKQFGEVHSIEDEPTKYNIGLDTIVKKPDGAYDFAFIDGPKGAWNKDKTIYSREASIAEAMEHTEVIIVHNAHRAGEKHATDKLLKGWQAVDLKVDRGMVAYFEKGEPFITLAPKIKTSKGKVKLLTSCRGFGGSEKSTIMLMRMFQEKGYKVELIPWGGDIKICTPYRSAIPKGVEITKGLAGPCDLLLYYATDTVYFPETKEAWLSDLMHKSKAEKKVMVLNYKLGPMGNLEWSKGWDYYMFLCSQKRGELIDRLPDANTVVLPPPTDLTEFYEIKRRYHLYKYPRLIRHNAQGDAKWPKDVNKFVENVWHINPKTEWICMPAASWLVDDPRIHKFKVNEMLVPEFLKQGNVFIYNLPEKYEDQGPRVIMEAMATGLPVIADNRYGAADRVNDETGWLCDSQEDYFQAIKDISELPSLIGTKGKAARKFAKDNFDPYRWVEAILG